MIMLILFGFFVAVSLITLFAANIHGYAGAVILGLNALVVDLFWQWLRMKIAYQNKTNPLWWAILGGLVTRVLSIYLFIRVGLWWLGDGKINTAVAIFTIILLTLPIWSIVASYKFKSEGN
jgi:hypothetical protein